MKTSSILDEPVLVTRLHPEIINEGPSEIGTLFLSESYRRSGIGRLLSLSRFLFIRNQPKRFKDTVIAEMRGVSSELGISPFWDSLGNKFFQIEFNTADRLSSKDKTFIAELLPKYPIYTNFLSNEAKSVIGKTHPSTVGALKLLEAQGFSYSNYIDIFDAGPKISSQVSNIHSIRSAATVQISDISHLEAITDCYIISTSYPNFRAVLQPVSFEEDRKIIIDPICAELLEVSIGDTLSIYNPFEVTL